MKITRYSVPERAKMFRVPAAEVLWCADILRGSELHEEIIVRRPKEGALTIHCGLTDYARFMDVEVLKRIIAHAIGEFVSIMMTFRASRSALTNAVCENLSSRARFGWQPRDPRNLRKRIW